jgi:hypothetical protein
VVLLVVRLYLVHVCDQLPDAFVGASHRLLFDAPIVSYVVFKCVQGSNNKKKLERTLAAANDVTSVTPKVEMRRYSPPHLPADEPFQV